MGALTSAHVAMPSLQQKADERGFIPVKGIRSFTASQKISSNSSSIASENLFNDQYFVYCGLYSVGARMWKDSLFTKSSEASSFSYDLVPQHSQSYATL